MSVAIKNTARDLAEKAERSGISVGILSDNRKYSMLATDIHFRRTASGRRNKSVVEMKLHHPQGIRDAAFDADTVLEIED